MSDICAELRALVLPTGVTSIARADLFNEAADEIEQLTEDLAALGGLNQAFDKERFRLRALLQRVIDWSPALPAEASLINEIASELAPLSGDQHGN